MNAEIKEWSTHLPVPLVVLDENLDLVDASRAAFSMFRIRYRESDKARSLEELGDYLLSHKAFVSSVGEASLKLTRLGSKDRIRWHDDDRIFDIEVSTMPPLGTMHYGLHFQDVTKKIEFERSREVTRNYLEQMIDSLPLGIVVVDCDMCITAMNRVQQEFLALRGSNSSLLSAVGTRLYDLLPEHDGFSWNSISDHLFVDKKAICGIEYTCNIDDVERTFSVNLIPLQEENGDVIGAMHITEEITEKLRLLAEAHETEVLSARLETLQHIVVTLNHVINNKLMGIMCSVEIVRSTGEPLCETKLKVLNDVMNESQNIADFIRDLADIKEIKITDYLKGGQKMLDVYAP